MANGYTVEFVLIEREKDELATVDKLMVLYCCWKKKEKKLWALRAVERPVIGIKDNDKTWLIIISIYSIIVINV